jgi:hypothetical protein
VRLKVRILSFLFYLGIPVFPSQKFWKKYKNTEVREHYKNARIALFVMNSCILISLLVWIFGITIYARYSPSSLETLVLFNRFYLIYGVAAIFVFGIIVWLIYTLGFLFKKEVKVKLFSKLKENQKILSLSYYFQTPFIIVLLMIVLTSVHSYKLSQNVIKPAKVYMLYDDMGFVPKWILSLGFYRIQLVAQNKYGVGRVSIEPINHDNLREALLNGTFIFLSVHGEWSYGKNAGTFHYHNTVRDKMYLCGPDQIKKMKIGENLRYVYLAQCNGGSLAREWSEVFYPAKVKFYNRISTYPEHIFWLWIKLTRILKSDVE